MALTVRQSLEGFVLWLMEFRCFFQIDCLLSDIRLFIWVFRSTMASNFCGVRGSFLSLLRCLIRLIVCGVRFGLYCFLFPVGGVLRLWFVGC